MHTLVLTLILLLGFSSQAAAWGELGHKIVCEIAYRQAGPEARAEIRRLIGEDPEYNFFSDSCIWPDHPKTRKKEHYVNLPRNATSVTTSSCPFGGKCLFGAIASDRKILANKANGDERRLRALKYLGHWIGDLHQPLHVSLVGDSGGNAIGVTGECTFELHATWDYCLVAASVSADVGEAATALISDITPTMKDQWTQGDVPDWANESLAITRAPTTKYCIQAGSVCKQPAGDVQIDGTYVNDHKAIVRERLAKAGVRLGHMLTRALGP
jgi:hypothetical protein